MRKVLKLVRDYSFTSPLVGEVGPKARVRGKAEFREAVLQKNKNFCVLLLHRNAVPLYYTPHPPLRGDLSHKGRGKGIVGVILSGCLLLTACKVGPDYHTPPINVPEKWENISECSEKKGNIWQEIYWWENYQDPLLTDLVREALKSNYDLKTAFAKIEEARALLLGADATLTPGIDAIGSFSHNENSVSTRQFTDDQGLTPFVPVGGTAANRYFDIYNIGFTTNWEIDLFGRLRRGIEAAEANVDAQIEDMHNTLLSLIAEVALNYINLRNYQHQLEVTQKFLEAWDSIYKLNKDLLQAGRITEIDVANAKASRDQAAARLSPLKANIKTTMHQLSVLIGKSPTYLYCLLAKTQPLPHIPSKVFAGLPSELLKRRPDIREAERTLAASTAEIGVAEGRLFPVFSFTGTLGYQSNFASNLFTPLSGFYSFGPGFSWPVVDFGRVRALINASIAVRDENLFQYKSIILKALADVENALVNYASEAKRFHDLKNSYEASKKAAELSLVRYKAGRINFIEVLQAELTYQTYALTLVQSQATLALNSVFLYKALGGGWQVDQTGWCANTPISSEAHKEPAPAPPIH